MLLLQRTRKYFGVIDGSSIRPDGFVGLSLEQINATVLSTESGKVTLSEVFELSLDQLSLEPFLVIAGDCETIEGLGTHMQNGTICILGNVGDNTGKSMSGGTLVVSGNARDHLGAGMTNGLVYVLGNCRHGLASPLAGKKSGMRGGDILVAGNVGDRACERMRRGTVFVGGDAGDYCAPQMIAGTLVVMGNLGSQWAGGMRRGSLILGRDFSTNPTASLSEAREFELSFLPLIWRHVEKLQNEAFAILSLAMAQTLAAPQRASTEVPSPIKIPRTRWVQRQIADLNCNGRGEVLVLRRVSSPAYGAR